MANSRSMTTTNLDVPASPTWRSRAASAAARRTIRQFNSSLPSNRLGVAIGRGAVAAFMSALGPPLPGTTVVPVRDPKVRGEWVLAPGVRHADRAIYYIHGSAYVICSPRTHRGLASRLSRKTGLPVFLIDYRLAPEHVFPAAADDVESGYRWLLSRGLTADQIVVAGDSAGGHLALDLLIDNARTGTPQPAGVALFSPLVDLTFELAAAEERHRPDPLITARAARRTVALYTAGQPDDHHRLKLAFPPRIALPPILVQAGGDEMLAADARYLQKVVSASGNSCELEIWPGQFHVFQALPRLIPEAEPALDRAASFVGETLAGASTPEEKVS
ncbi:alpha/beta hydrolase [Smaragdicoccus niigatensis]